MNKEFSRSCFRIAIFCFAIIACSLLFYQLLNNLPGIYNSLIWLADIFDSIIIAFIIAYILHTPIKFFKRLFRMLIKKDRLLNCLAVTVTYTLLVIGICIFVWHLIPAITNNIVYFAYNLNGYLDSFAAYIEDISKNLYAGQRILEYFYGFVYRLSDTLRDWFTGNFMALVSMVFRTTNIVVTFIAAFVVSVYMSLSCDSLISQIKKALFALFPKKFCRKTIHVFRVVNESFAGYMSGVFVSAIIIGLMCWTVMSLCGLHYAPLISFIVMLTDVIPYFGPFIGAVVGSVLLLLVNPWDALWFLIIIIVLQQLTSNLINPGIIGKATGLDSVYVILSIIVMGGFFGIFGMIVGVPIFVIIFRAIRKFIAARAKEIDDEKSIQQ